jgi:hypothetical protein
MSEIADHAQMKPPQGRERIRRLLSGAESCKAAHDCRCPKHEITALDGTCPRCIELGSQAARSVRIRLERILGGSVDASARAHAELRQEVDRFLERSGVTRMVMPAPRVLEPMLKRNAAIPQAIRACRRLCELIEQARFADWDCHQALEELGYCGIPSEQKLERLMREANAAAGFLEAWDEIAFDAAHEHELEECARRLVAASRDARTLLDSIRFRPLDKVIAAARRRQSAIDAVRPHIRER